MLQCPRWAVAAVYAIRRHGPRDRRVDAGRRGALVDGDGSRAFALQGTLAADGGGGRAEPLHVLGERTVERCIVGVGLGSHRLSEAEPDCRRKGLPGSGDKDSGTADR